MPMLHCDDPIVAPFFAKGHTTGINENGFLTSPGTLANGSPRLACRLCLIKFSLQAALMFKTPVEIDVDCDRGAAIQRDRDRVKIRWYEERARLRWWDGLTPEERDRERIISRMEEEG